MTAMFALKVVYLTGRAVSTDVASRDVEEWPPHPARVFSALVSTMYETQSGDACRSALQWLEALPPPDVCASTVSRRTAATHFVPVNEARAMGDDDPLLGLLPERRSRQPRTFPSVTPHDPVVYFAWPEAAPTREVREALSGLARKVSYLGHSSSLVAMAVVEQTPSPAYIPDDSDGYIALRVTSAGQLAALDDAHALAQKTGVRGRLPASFRLYRPASDVRRNDDSPGGYLGELWVLRRKTERDATGARPSAFPATATVTVTAALRGSVMAAWSETFSETVPEVLSGHDADGKPSTAPHVAFVALPDVAHAHAEGHLLGVALALPCDIDREARRRLAVAVERARGNPLVMGKSGAWQLERSTPDERTEGLRADTWTATASRWASVTPVVLDRFPDEFDGLESEEIIRRACVQAGLPSPKRVMTSALSPHVGVEPSRVFAVEARPGKPRRLTRHAIVEFETPVRGPLLVGAGRYRGLGLFRPWEERVRGGAR